MLISVQLPHINDVRSIKLSDDKGKISLLWIDNTRETRLPIFDFRHQILQ